jgi:hypothetical protein
MSFTIGFFISVNRCGNFALDYIESIDHFQVYVHFENISCLLFLHNFCGLEIQHRISRMSNFFLLLFLEEGFSPVIKYDYNGCTYVPFIISRYILSHLNF